MKANIKTSSICVLLLLAACVSTPEKTATINSIDGLVNTAAAKTVLLLPDNAEQTLAVYYFTVDGEKSPLSEYLVNSLTTEIANRIKTQKPAVSIVSRQNLDQVIAELQFQVSSLVDEKSQLSLGRQLGADIILTGSITPLAAMYKLNAQLVRVETGVVLGGFVLDFKVEKELEAKIAPTKEGVSETIKIDEKVVTHGGVAATTTLFETFETKALAVQLLPSVDFYGAGIVSPGGKVVVESNSGVDGTPAARWNLKGKVSTPPVTPAFGESYLVWYLQVKGNWQFANFDGLAVSLKPVGLDRLNLKLVQEKGKERSEFPVSITLNENQWQDLKIPFYDFYGHGKKLDSKLPLFIECDISYAENYHDYFFRSAEVDAALLIDNLGFYKVKGKDENGLLESFNDEINRMTIDVSLYNSSLYTAYELTEGKSEAEAAKIDILRAVKGITGQVLSVQRKAGGLDAGYLALSAQISVTAELAKFLEQYPYYNLTLFVKWRAGKTWKGFRSLNYYIKSDTLTGGGLELMHNYSENDAAYFSTEVTAGPVWSKLTVPFSQFRTEGSDLAAHNRWTDEAELQFYFDVARELLDDAVRTGTLKLDLCLDNFYLE